MPYITSAGRHRIDDTLRDVLTPGAGPGQLAYAITRLVDDWIGPEPTFFVLAEALGALEAAKLELYRRVVAPYEDHKIVENGDVYMDRRYAR